MLSAVKIAQTGRLAVFFCVLTFCTVALGGCDPVPVPRHDDTARLSVVLDATGGAEVQLVVGGDPGRDRLRALGRTLDGLLPASMMGNPRIDSNLGAFPFVKATVADAYVPGRSPIVHLDTRATVSALREAGITKLDINVSAPYIASSTTWAIQPTSTERRTWSWDTSSTADPPRGTIRLHPVPWHGWFQLGLLTFVALVIATGFALWRTDRSAAAIVCGAIASVAGATTIPLAGGAQMENLGVSGDVTESALDLLRWLPLVTLAGACAGVTLVVLAIIHRPKRMAVS